MATPAKLKLAAIALSLSVAGLSSIKLYEGNVRNAVGHAVAYRDTGGVVTVCYGHTATAKMGQVLSENTCDYLLRKDTTHAVTAVQKHVSVPVTQGQFNALVSFTFNVGEPQFANSTLLRMLNAGDCYGAAKQFDRWVYDNGVKYTGLAVRRARERADFEPGCSPKG